MRTLAEEGLDSWDGVLVVIVLGISPFVAVCILKSIDYQDR